MCGNSIGQDRRFLARYMPRLEAFFHYRNVDVSSLKELAKRWRPEVCASFKKQQKHTALADVHESIDELAHYRTHFLRVDEAAAPSAAAICISASGPRPAWAASASGRQMIVASPAPIRSAARAPSRGAPTPASPPARPAFCP